MARRFSDRNYSDLLRFRTQLRRFERWSEAQAREVGLTHMQHQLLLAIRGHDGPGDPSIGDLAEYLLLKLHSTTELIDRSVATGDVRRVSDPDDARIVRVQLTTQGQEKLTQLTNVHIEELKRLRPVFTTLMGGIGDGS